MYVIFIQHNTKYFYELGSGSSSRQFSFIAPPEVGPDVPYTFGVIGTTTHSLTLFLGNQPSACMNI